MDHNVQKDSDKVLKCPDCKNNIVVKDLVYSRCYNCWSSFELGDDLSIIKFRHFPKIKKIGYIFLVVLTGSILVMLIADEAKYPILSNLSFSLFFILVAICCVYNFYIALMHGVISIRGGDFFIEKNPILFVICVLTNFIILGASLWFGVPMMHKVFNMISI